MWMAGTARDVTDEHRSRVERQRLEEEFLRAQKLEALALLSGEIAHDFNNALTAIRGYAALVLDQLDPDSPAARDALELCRTAEHATALPRQLLAFARGQTARSRELHLNTMLQELKPLLQHLLGVERSLAVPEEDDEIWVRADPGQLEQALVNVTSTRVTRWRMHRARSPSEHGWSTSTRPRRRPFRCRAGTLRLAHRHGHGRRDGRGDRGPRGRAVLHDEAGSRRHRARAARGHRRRDARAEVACASRARLGAGTTVEILLPAAERPVRSQPAPSAPDDGRADATVVVVDDEPHVLAVIARVLEEAGYAVVAMPSAADALARLRDVASDAALLVTDLRMPEMSGIELAAAARRAVPGASRPLPLRLSRGPPTGRCRQPAARSRSHRRSSSPPSSSAWPHRPTGG